MEKAFTSIEGIKAAAGGGGYEVEVADLAKVKEALGKISEASKEAGESATKALDSTRINF